MLAAIALPLGMVSSWIAGVLTDTDRYVATVEPLATDPVVKQAAIEHLQRQALALVDQSVDNPQLGGLLEGFGYGELGDSLDDLTSGLTDAFRPEIEAIVRSVVVGVVESPAFARSWAAANRSAHEQLVAILEDEDGTFLDRNGRVSIELGTVLNTVLAGLGQQGLQTSDELPSVPTSFQLVKGSDLERARAGYHLLDALGFWLPVLWLALVAAALALSPRRWRVALWLGVGTALGALALLVALAVARGALAGSSGDPEVVKAIWDAVMAGLRRTALVAVALGLAAALAGGWLDRASR